MQAKEDSRPSGHAVVSSSVRSTDDHGELRNGGSCDGANHLGAVLRDSLRVGRLSVPITGSDKLEKSEASEEGETLTPFSASLPTMNPEMLTRKTRGIPRCSQS